MSVEQTTQLIQLILNSVLLAVTCVLVLGRLGVRLTATEEQLRVATRRYLDLLDNRSEAEGNNRAVLWQNRLPQAKKALRQIQRRYGMIHYSLLATYYALLFAVVSIFTLALRTMVNADWLIVLALGLFIVSVIVLLLGVGLTLLDLHSSKLPLWHDVERMLGLGRLPSKMRPGLPENGFKKQGKALRQASDIRSAARVRVG